MERQNVEWKRQWDDKFLRQICGFANSEGGVMKVGIEDDGTVVGVKDPKSDMKSITDTIANKLSIYPTVDVDEKPASSPSPSRSHLSQSTSTASSTSAQATPLMPQPAGSTTCWSPGD